MTDIKIITQFRSVAENEHLFRSGLEDLSMKQLG